MLFYILIPLLLVWGTITYFLFRWRRWVGGLFIALSVIVLVVAEMNSGVERQFDELMSYEIVEVGDYRTLRLTNSHGDGFTAGSAGIVDRLKVTRQSKVHVVMAGWYDFNQLRAYRVYRIDGELQ